MQKNWKTSLQGSRMNINTNAGVGDYKCKVAYHAALRQCLWKGAPTCQDSDVTMFAFSMSQK